MRWHLPAAFVTLALVGASCPSGRAGLGACIGACEAAARCGVLPSTLGGAVGEGPDAAEVSCVDRCSESDVNASVAAILGCLNAQEVPEFCPVDACVGVIECLRAVAPDTVVGAPQVTFRLIDGEHWSLLFQPELCAAVDPELSVIDPETFAEYCKGEDDPCRIGEGMTADQRLPLCGATECDEVSDARPPECTDAGCVVTSDEGPPRCDPRLCDGAPSASYDCTELGIEFVHFGYLDDHDVLHLAPTRSTCAEASQGVVLEGIAPGQVIYPIARFEGHITAGTLLYLDPLDPMTPWETPSAAIGRPYCWYSVPNPPAEIGWFVRAGEIVVPVPSPSSAIQQALTTGDRGRFPRGCGCPLEGGTCEGADASECGNGRDDDDDGLIDGEDPGCE